MPQQQVPNIRVWWHAKEYVEAAELLLDANRLLQAAVLSALAIEILLKSFLAEDDNRGKSSSERGHKLTVLFSLLSTQDQNELLSQS